MDMFVKLVEGKMNPTFSVWAGKLWKTIAIESQIFSFRNKVSQSSHHWKPTATRPLGVKHPLNRYGFHNMSICNFCYYFTLLQAWVEGKMFCASQAVRKGTTTVGVKGKDCNLSLQLWRSMVPWRVLGQNLPTCVNWWKYLDERNLVSGQGLQMACWQYPLPKN
jgi:hypothetical protein